MKVRELIDKLKECDQDLPFCVADWNESYAAPSEAALEDIGELECKYSDSDWKLCTGKIVVLGY